MEESGLVSLIRDFCFPAGIDVARSFHGLKIRERGEMRATPEARWLPFTAEQTIDARRNRFRWEARVGDSIFFDAYQDGRGMAGAQPHDGRPLQKIASPEIDRAELQRYFASIPMCPSILVNHPSLRWTTAAPLSLSLRDETDVTAAVAELILAENGRPLQCRAARPRMLGPETLRTPWLGQYLDFQEWNGMRLAGRIAVSWLLPDNEFEYYRSEIASIEALQ